MDRGAWQAAVHGAKHELNMTEHGARTRTHVTVNEEFCYGSCK